MKNREWEVDMGFDEYPGKSGFQVEIPSNNIWIELRVNSPGFSVYFLNFLKGQNREEKKLFKTMTILAGFFHFQVHCIVLIVFISLEY